MQNRENITFSKNLEYLAQIILDEEYGYIRYLISCHKDDGLGFLFVPVMHERTYSKQGLAANRTLGKVCQKCKVEMNFLETILVQMEGEASL